MSQPQWEQVGDVGDVNWPEYDGGPVFVDKTGVYPPELEYIETPPEGSGRRSGLDDFEHPDARWTVYRVSLEKGVPDWIDLESVANTSGQDPEELREAFESDDPMERAFAYETLAGYHGWYELDQYPLTLTCSEINKRYPQANINCFGTITSAIEETVERMADESSAQAWSTPGDQLLIDLEAEGFDPDTVVSIADFGDAVAVNGDITDETVVEVMKKLEAEGYEETSFGGRIPAEDGYAYADHVIRAVARDLKLPEDHVRRAAETLDWWQEEIPHGTSGDGSVWAKRKAGTEERRRSTMRESTWVPPALAAEGITPTMLEVVLDGMGEHARIRPGQSVVYDRDGYAPLRQAGYIVLKRAMPGLSTFGDYYVLTDKGADLLRRWRVETRKIGTTSRRR